VRNPVEEFERQYRESGDPWDLATSAYEQGRYDSTIAALEGRRYGRALELGASIGILSGRLAALSDELVTLEPAPTAVAQARAHLKGRVDVEVLEGSAPEDLPDGPFDLIVCSEVLYYFSADELHTVLDAVEARLSPGGLLIAVHWRGLGTHQLTGDQVHQALGRRDGLHRVNETRNPGYVLDVFRRTGT
jgi:SAM-dependent methyltransferase